MTIQPSVRARPVMENGSGQHSQTTLPGTSLERFFIRLSLRKIRDITVAPRAVLLGDCAMRSYMLLWLVRILVRGCLIIPSGLQPERVLLCKTCIIPEIVADLVPRQAE